MNLGRESEHVEFESSLSRLDRGLESLAAMLNRHKRGTVYFGVDDAGEVTGILVGKNTLEEIRGRIRQTIDPQITAEIKELLSDDGRRYIEVSAQASDVPYSFNGRYYIRNVSSNESMTAHLLRQYIWSINADPLKEMSSDVQDLTFEQLKVLMSSMRLSVRDDIQFYQSLGFYNSDKEFNMVAYLLSDQNSTVMQVVWFEGTDKTAISRRTDFGHRCLLMTVEDVLNRIGSMMVSEVDMSSGIRVETPLFDIEAFREAWVNACVHNNWRFFVPPSVFVFDDRMEIQSYGSLPFGQNMDDFFKGISRPVNQTLFDVFIRMGRSERTGHGVPTVMESCGRQAYDILDDMIVVTIPFRFEPLEVAARKEAARRFDDITPRQRELLAYLGAHPHAKLAEVSKSLGINLSTVKRDVVTLKALGILRNEGRSNRENDWRV